MNRTITVTDFLELQSGSDIRGVALEGVDGERITLTADMCRQIGAAFALWLSEKLGKRPEELTVGIGYDSRISSAAFEKAVAAGLRSQNVRAVRCGLATTPAMFMGIIFERTHFDGSVMITASHLPFNRNGVKFFDKDGGLEHDNITDILRRAAAFDPAALLQTDTAAEQCDLLGRYAAHLRNAITASLSYQSDHPLAGLKIVVDAGNGSGGFFAGQVLQPLGADIRGSQFLEPDGRFPHHIPNPEDKTAMAAIKAAVVQSGADLGLIFDTDVDRMSAVLAGGAEVNRDAVIALIAAVIAPQYPGGVIVTDSVTSDRLTVFLERELRLTHLRYMRGYKNVINKCKELNAAGICCPLAMETSGHGALKENYYLDDGAFLAVKLVVALAEAKRAGRDLHSLIEKLPQLVEDGEFRFKIRGEDFRAYGTAVLSELKARAQKAHYTLPESHEGVRIAFDSDRAQGWMLLRLSLHDPVMPLNIEGRRPGDVRRIAEIARDLLSGFDRLDMSCLPPHQ